jgi:predicted nucleic acid-binding Zn ribbon protein
MTAYVYKFEDGTLLEVEQKMADEPYTVLPHPYKVDEDGGMVHEPVKRVPVWRTDPVFKGKGFYKNDKT